ncbi:MAG TPA: hypothetical protein VJ841_01425 [Candidatus Saccharimonadales bacterium]|nr:hypothetical protein [Candidatus Saccharimonadales bacterium]
MIAVMILLAGVGMGAVACATSPRSLLKRLGSATQKEAWVIDVDPSTYLDEVQRRGGAHR